MMDVIKVEEKEIKAQQQVILFVDDNQALAAFSARNLKNLRPNWHIIVASSCSDARRVIDNAIPSAVIVDLNLPDGNGLDLIFEFKVRHPQLPIILISASVSERMAEEARNRGAFAVVEKPYEVSSLIDFVEFAAEESRKRSLSGLVIDDAGMSGEYSPWTFSCDKTLDFHRLQNRLSTLIAGIRAMEAEMVARAGDPSEIERIAREYPEDLCRMVMEVSGMLSQAGKARKATEKSERRLAAALSASLSEKAGSNA